MPLLDCLGMGSTLPAYIKAEREKWSGTIGQFNMLHYCAGSIFLSENLWKVKFDLPPPVKISPDFLSLLRDEVMEAVNKKVRIEESISSLHNSKDTL